MCGIVGYCGRRAAAPILLAGLKKLEYRGYDSAGVAVLNGTAFAVVRRAGRVSGLDGAASLMGNAGIGHTRWATHGAPSERNAHPHVWGDYAVVHNGIVENEHALKAECLARGEEFLSETDSEIVAHLLAREAGDPLVALRNVCARLEGSYALAVLCARTPGTVYCARRGSPLIVGRGKDGLYAASDAPAIATEAEELYALRDGEFAVLAGEEARIFNGELAAVSGDRIVCAAADDAPALDGFNHYMRKEMSEIPAVFARSLTDFAENSEFCKVLCQTEYIQIAACGTAYHSGLCAKFAIERFCRIPAETYIASEYRYLDPIVKENTLFLAVSQSGETADTLAAARLAAERGAVVVAVTNVAYSSLTRIARFTLLTQAGREIAVAATKSFNAQLALLYSLTAALARQRGRLAADPSALAPILSDALARSEETRAWTPFFAGARGAYFIGRGADHAVALEGSLKLKEVSYLPGEGYPAGELKHGTLALIDDKTPVVALAFSERLAEKTMNAVREVAARGAKVFLITCFEELCARKGVFRSLAVRAQGGVPLPAPAPLRGGVFSRGVRPSVAGARLLCRACPRERSR